MFRPYRVAHLSPGKTYGPTTLNLYCFSLKSRSRDLFSRDDESSVLITHRTDKDKNLEMSVFMTSLILNSTDAESLI